MEWIKVEDKLPEVQKACLVTIKIKYRDFRDSSGYISYKTIGDAEYNPEDGKWYQTDYLGCGLEPLYEEVIAWMPYPDPYEEN